MSVVNKMLQDLEQRQADANGINSNYQAPQKRSYSLYLPILLSAVLLAAGGWWLYNSKSVETVAADTNQPAELQASQPQTVPASVQPRPMLSAQPAAEQGMPVQAQQPAENTQQLPETDTVSEQTDPTSEPEIALAQEAPANIMRVSKNSTLTIKDPRAEAQFALQQGDAPSAINALYELLEAEPENIAARKKLASLLFSEGKESSAETLLSKGLDEHPNSADLRLMLARIYSQRQRQSEALGLLQEINVYALNNPDYVAYRASLAKQLNQHQSAYQDYLQLAKAQPEQAKWWLGFAIAAERVDETPSAVAAYERALSLDQLSGEVAEFMRKRIRYLRAQS